MFTKNKIQFYFTDTTTRKISSVLRTFQFKYKNSEKKKLYLATNTFSVGEQIKPKLVGFQNQKNVEYWKPLLNKKFFSESLVKKNLTSSFVYKYIDTFQKTLEYFFLLKPSFFFHEKKRKVLKKTEVSSTSLLFSLAREPLTKTLIDTEYWLQKYQRSNQDTCLNQRPSVKEGEWVQKGDFISDSSASVSGELALGKNILVGYMPWEGYNFEDAIVLSERLVYDAVYTSLHIERYEIQIEETVDGFEEITKQIYELIFPDKFWSKKFSKKKKYIENKKIAEIPYSKSSELKKQNART